MIEHIKDSLITLHRNGKTIVRFGPVEGWHDKISCVFPLKKGKTLWGASHLGNFFTTHTDCGKILTAMISESGLIDQAALTIVIDKLEKGYSVLYVRDTPNLPLLLTMYASKIIFKLVEER